MIEMQELAGLNEEQIINLLLEQKNQPFEIYIPKETKEFFSERAAISMDYANLAYSGQLLFDIAEEFDFEEIPPHQHESVLFTIKIKDLEKLASVLLDISYGYVNDYPDDEDFSFIELSSNYIYEVEQGKISNVACQYFLDVSKEFETEDGDEDDV